MLKRSETSTTGLRTKIIGLLSAMFLLLSVLFASYTYVDQRDKAASELLDKSRVLVAEMQAAWEFVSINQNVINYTSEGDYDYKGLHCAIAGKSIAALFSENSNYTIRFVNLAPRNVYNSPDSYEKDALERFGDDSTLKEVYSYSDEDDTQVFRYVSVMRVTQDCIECHGGPKGEIDPTGYPKEGWEVGDIAGAVSVISPTDISSANNLESLRNYVLFFVFLMVVMVLGIYTALSRLVTNPLERLQTVFASVGETGPDSKEYEAERAERIRLIGSDHRHLKLDSLADEELASEPPTLQRFYSTREVDDLFDQYESMAERLSLMYSNLESQVDERTSQLREANEELERQRAEVELVNKKLSRDNQYKSDFLAIVSHELRTPLTSIVAFTELMMENVSADDEVASQQLLEIEKNGSILLEMVDNVLETARIQAGSEHLNLELVDFADVLGMVESTNEGPAMKKGISLSTRIDKDVPLVSSDWEKTRRILTNLVSNAVKFTPAGGSVDVCIELDKSKRFVCLRVKDTGIGIPKDKQSLVFERFTQENMSTVRRYGGSGLGLSLVKELSAMLGGRVELESEPGCGSCFTVFLPVDGPQTPEQ